MKLYSYTTGTRTEENGEVFFDLHSGFLLLCNKPLQIQWYKATIICYYFWRLMVLGWVVLTLGFLCTWSQMVARVMEKTPSARGWNKGDSQASLTPMVSLCGLSSTEASTLLDFLGGSLKFQKSVSLSQESTSLECLFMP